MTQTLCALAAGLLVGQAQDVTIVQSEPVQPKCNCAASAQAGWTQVQTSTQSRTWTQSGTWTPANGWTWSNSAKDATEDRPFLSRFADRVGSLFGSKQETARPSAGWQSTAWQTTGWVEMDPQEHDQAASIQLAPGPLAASISPLWIADHQPRRMPSAMATLNEPPLLDATASRPVTAAVEAVKPASFQPSEVQVVAAPAAKSEVQAPGNKYGHEEDYSWISGPIDIVNGAHLVQYVTPGSADRFGGHMILSGDPDLTQLEKGDLVKIHGSVVPGRTISIYRVRAIEILERPAR